MTENLKQLSLKNSVKKSKLYKACVNLQEIDKSCNYLSFICHCNILGYHAVNYNINSNNKYNFVLNSKLKTQTI